MTVRINDIPCPACQGILEIIKGAEPYIHCTNCERDWETGLIPHGKEMQPPEDFNIQDIIQKCKVSYGPLGYTPDKIKFKGFRLYFDAEGTILSRGFFMCDFDPDRSTDE